MTHGEPDLLDPSDEDEDPIKHLQLLPSNGEYRAIGPKGVPSKRAIINEPFPAVLRYLVDLAIQRHRVAGW